MSEIVHLPPELSSFVGRNEELALIDAAIAPGKALTLVGPGGCGKTRLAIRSCHAQVSRWRDGVVWVGLERLTDPDAVAVEVARVLDLPQVAGSDATGGLAAALSERHLLLVLDNCEHVLAGVGDLVCALLAGCPGIGVLATSRSALGLAGGEQAWPVPPLALPDALALFLDRAGLAAPDEVRADVHAGSRRVCDRLDRLPLALELAAGWIGTLTPAQIADSLGDPYALLDAGRSTAPFRQRTLEDSMRWSHDLLDERERVLFRQLAIFEPGFDADAVLALAGCDGRPDGQLLKALRGLIDKSLVVADTTGLVARYQLLGTVRAYALARLDEAETETTRQRHLDAFLARVDEAEPLLDVDKDEWRERIGADYPNIRVAIEWGLSRDDPTRGRRLAAGVAWLWHLEDRGNDGLRFLRQAVAVGRGARTELHARCLVALALDRKSVV